MNQQVTLFVLGLMITSFPVGAEERLEVSGKLGVEARLFAEDGSYPGQTANSDLSLLVEPELFWDWNGGADTLTFRPFVRWDQRDSERTHSDIRELMWNHLGDDWELRTGIGKVFWGVTEFQHLVDTINQTDLVENIDGEEKLGQPMVNLSLVRDWGIVDLFLLPGFRERTFPGVHGRLRTPVVVDTERAFYESSRQEQHVDFAARWSHTLGDYDIGLHWFRGTNRDPILQAGMREDTPILIPYYEQMTQFGLDLQATKGGWLWKLETIQRHGENDDFWAAQGGFEYTLVGIRETATDLGLLLEYGWDERGTDATAPMQNDLFLGTRLALNDEAGSELLAGFGYDIDYDTKLLSVEASRRFGGDWKASLDARFFFTDNPSDPLYSLRDDGHLQVTLERYF